MPKALPSLPRRNAAWTPLQRRAWLAEQRHQKRLLAMPVLDPPTLVRVGGFYIGTATVTTSIWQFAQTDSRYYDGPVQDWADGADLSDASYTLLPPNQAQSAHLFIFCACRYQVSGVWSPWCAVIESD